QQQQGRRGDGHEHAAVLRRRPPHERGNQQNRHCRISQVNESHCRTNFDCSHVSPSLSEVLVSRASRRVSTRHATVRSPRYGSFGTSPLRRKVGALGVFFAFSSACFSSVLRFSTSAGVMEASRCFFWRASSSTTRCARSLRSCCDSSRLSCVASRASFRTKSNRRRSFTGLAENSWSIARNSFSRSATWPTP